MRRGFLTTLLVAFLALSAVNTARAASPSLSNIPVIIISDLENNQGTVDNNLFVFTDAFAFADYVTDPDTLAGDLDWSFDYATGMGNVGDIEINGVARLNGGDPLTPGALAINTSGTASFREVALSPTSGSAPFGSPAAGMDGVDTGVGIFNDVVGDVAVTYYVSDGANFDMTDSFVYTVDTDLGAAGPGDQAGGGGPPVLTYTPITPLTAAGGWVFTPGDGTFVAATTSGETGGLQITHAAASPTTALTFYTGIWTKSDIASLMTTGDNVYSVRASIAANVDNTPSDGAQPRIRLEPAAGNTAGMDQQLVITENDATSPFHPSTTGTTYVAYFPKYELASDGQVGLAVDLAAAGSTSGPRTVTFGSLEIGSDSITAFTGSSMALASGTFTSGQFGNWSYLNLGPGVFGGITFWQGGTSSTAGGTIAHTDVNGDGTQNGGVALYDVGEFNTFDTVEYMPGAFYHNQFEISVADGADTDYPTVQIEARARNASQQNAASLRTDGDHYDNTVTSGMNGLYNLLWVAPDNGAGTGDGSENDLIEGFNLFNNNPFATHGGTTTLNAARYFVLGPNDPNN